MCDSLEYLKETNPVDFINQFLQFQVPLKGKYNPLEYIAKQEWNLETKKFANARFAFEAPMYVHLETLSNFFANHMNKTWKDRFCMIKFNSTSKAYAQKIYQLRQDESAKKAKDTKKDDDKKDDKNNDDEHMNVEGDNNNDNDDGNDGNNKKPSLKRASSSIGKQKPKQHRSEPRQTIVYSPNYGDEQKTNES